jgi:hypothetical protein
VRIFKAFCFVVYSVNNMFQNIGRLRHNLRNMFFDMDGDRFAQNTGFRTVVLAIFFMMSFVDDPSWMDIVTACINFVNECGVLYPIYLPVLLSYIDDRLHTWSQGVPTNVDHIVIDRIMKVRYVFDVILTAGIRDLGVLFPVLTVSRLMTGVRPDTPDELLHYRQLQANDLESLAFLMGRHARLGEGSVVRLVDDSVLGIIWDCWFDGSYREHYAHIILEWTYRTAPGGFGPWFLPPLG